MYDLKGNSTMFYNATHVTDKDGFQETELTLIRPERS